MSKPRSHKYQACHEHAKGHVRLSTGLDIPVSQFCELQESDPLLEKFTKGGGKASYFKQDGLWYTRKRGIWNNGIGEHWNESNFLL